MSNASPMECIQLSNELVLGGPGSGPQKGGALAKHSSFGIPHRSVRDRVKMNYGRMKPHLAKAGKAARRLGKKYGPVAAVLGGVAAAGEGLNYIAKKRRGDNDNRRVAAYGTALYGGATGAVANAARKLPRSPLRNYAVRSAVKGGIVTAILGNETFRHKAGKKSKKSK